MIGLKVCLGVFPNWFSGRGRRFLVLACSTLRLDDLVYNNHIAVGDTWYHHCVVHNVCKKKQVKHVVSSCRFQLGLL